MGRIALLLTAVAPTNAAKPVARKEMLQPVVIDPGLSDAIFGLYDGNFSD